MTVIPISVDSNPAYLINRSDIIDNKVPGVSSIGKTVLAVDTGEWFIVKSDLTLQSFSYPTLSTMVDSASIDAFARSRMSEPQTIFDSKNIFDDSDLAPTVENQPLFYDNAEVSGTGTSTTYNSNQSSQSINVSAATAGKRVRQSKMRFNYQPGKSQLILKTFNADNAVSGIKKLTGVFDSNNGIFLKLDGVVAKLVIRSNVTGTPVDTEISQTNWNVDRFDGTGISRITLDWTKTQILIIDYEWLGVGRVRVGFVVNGIPYYAHYFNNTNNLTTVYMSTPNLPLRSEIENTGTGIAATFTDICASVISEGGSQDLGALRYISTNGTHLDADVENTVYALMGIRLKSNYLAASVKLINIVLQLQTGSSKIEWILKLNPTVASTFTYSDVSRSAIQVARGVTANTVTGGYDITGGFVESGGVQGGNAGSGERGIDNAILLGSLIDGTADTMVLCVRPVGGSTNVDVEGSIAYRDVL